MAAVHGPLVPTNLNKEEELAIVSVIIKSGSQDSQMSALEYEWAEFLCQVLSACVDRKQHPRSVIQIVLQIIQGDGSLLSCLLHAAVASLMDAGVELFYLPVATTCLVNDGDDSNDIILDPCRAEEEEAHTSILVLVNETSRPDKILGSQTIGQGLSSLDKVLACVQAASKAGPAIVAFWRLAVEQKVTRESQTLWSKYFF